MALYPDKIVDVPEMPGIFRKAAVSPQKRSMVFYSPKGHHSILIGYLCDDQKKMVPNDNYIELFKDLWITKFGYSEIKPTELRFGLYAATKAIVEDCQLRELMNKAFGGKKTDELLDYAMYLILAQSDNVLRYEEQMCDQVLFSGKLNSDSTYALLFEKEIKDKEIVRFKKLWGMHCKEKGVTKVWLCIEELDADCKCKGVEPAEKDDAKSKKDTSMMSIVYAVTDTGFPVTFELCRGGMADTTAMKDSIDFLKECGIETEGVILERSYCDTERIRYLDEHGLHYVIKMKEIGSTRSVELSSTCTGKAAAAKDQVDVHIGEPAGYKPAADENKTVIRNNARYLVRKTHLYAVQKEIQLFSDDKKKDHVTVFYDFLDGAEKCSHYLDKLYAEIDRLEEQMGKGKNPEINEAFRNVLRIDPGTNEVCMDHGEIQRHMDEMGTYGIVHSQELTPYEVHQRYSSKNVSEKQYSVVKTLLDFDTESDAETKSKYCMGFISSIIRTYMERAADKVPMTYTSYIRELNQMRMIRGNKAFSCTYTDKTRQIQMLTQLGKKKEYPDEIVEEVNGRMMGHVPGTDKKKTGPKPKVKVTIPVFEEIQEPIQKPRGKPGPRPGFKRSDTNADGSKRQKPGPKPGSKKGKFNKDGSLRQKPGPKQGTHHASTSTPIDQSDKA